MDDELRRRLARIDPMPARVPVDHAGSPRARTLVEDIVTEEAQIRGAAGDEQRPTRARDGRRPRLLFAVGGLAAAAAVVAVVTLVIRDGSEPATRQLLTLPDAGTTIASCLPFDVEVLADMPVAFGGTVVAISDSAVSIEVDRWYRAPTEETDLVDVTVPAENTSAALDGVDFATGERYLITATNGIVNVCGYSGPATSQLEAAFETAFAS